MFQGINAQERSDTVLIGEVIINGKASSLSGSGFKTKEIDGSILAVSRQKNIGEVLSGNSFIFIKSYGLGSSATTSIRGAGASHTQVTWNGININNPMPGQADFSLIPSLFIDKAQILIGGASMQLASGGIGGIINLETKPVWSDKASLSLNPSIGSFGRYAGSIEARGGNSHFQTITKAFLESAENNFSYLNDVISADPVKEIRKNSQMRQNGFLQELYFKGKNSTSSARVWYQSANRNLPSPVSVPQDAGERQQDYSLRTMINHDAYTGNFKYSVTGAAIFNRLNYFNRLASIDSRNLAGKFVFKTKVEASLRKDLVFTTTLNNELSTIRSNNYADNVARNVFNLAASLEKKMTAWWGATMLVREILNGDRFLIPDITAGFEARLAEGRDHFLKLNISRNSKVPDLNDLYWIPGGNPNLKNEYGLSAELVYTISAKLSQNTDLLVDASFFRNSARDMIVWHPGEFSYWTADNFTKVNSLGSETSAALTWSRNRLSAKLSAGIALTSARQVSSDKQLIYVPPVRSNAGLSLSYSKIHFAFLTDYTGKIFITPDNSDFLEGFLL
jgi:iron complex outermembrane receptor protein